LTSDYNRWPDKAGPARRHFGRIVDRSIMGPVDMVGRRASCNEIISLYKELLSMKFYKERFEAI